MIRIRLTDTQAQQLERAFRQTADRKLRDRLQIVRLAHRGRPHQAIAADTLTDLRRSPRNSLSYSHTVRRRIDTLVTGCCLPPENRTASSGL